MTTTREALRGLLLDAIGEAALSGNASRTCSAQGAASGASLIDTGLKVYGNDYFAGWWVVLPDGPTGAGSYEARQVGITGTPFVSSTGTITPAVNFSAQIASAQAYELMPYDPVLLHAAINSACRLVYPYLYVAKRDETLVVNNRLLNWDMETAGANPPVLANWTAYGSPTITQNTTALYVWHSTNSAKIVSAAGDAGGVYQDIAASPFAIHEITGKSVEFEAKVWCDTASVARLRLSFDAGSTFTNGSYHTGADQWETLTVEGSVPSAATTLRCYLEVAAGTKTAYFDRAPAWVGTLYRYTVPSSIIEGPTRISIERDPKVAEGPFDTYRYGHLEYGGATRYLVVPSGLTSGAIIRMEGYGTLSTMTTDTATTEVDSPQTETLIAAAAWKLFEMLLAKPDGERYQPLVASWRERYLSLLTVPGLHHPRLVIPAADKWSVSAGGGRQW